MTTTTNDAIRARLRDDVVPWALTVLRAVKDFAPEAGDGLLLYEARIAWLEIHAAVEWQGAMRGEWFIYPVPRLQSHARWRAEHGPQAHARAYEAICAVRRLAAEACGYEPERTAT